MGFNSKGVEYVAERLQRGKFGGVLGVSIGKNASTPMGRAHEDYLKCFRRLYPLADYIAINVSSPNTLKLRELQSAEGLQGIISPLRDERSRLSKEHGKYVPLLVKVSPDLEPHQLTSVALELQRLDVDGVIATNTTVSLTGIAPSPVHTGGGLSGEPLHRRSLAVIRQLRAELGPGFPIVGVGGITDPQAALATLDAGANVIQLYTGLIYRGPILLHEILRSLLNR
jgi:dihydroorotate dehydrogenase